MASLLGLVLLVGGVASARGVVGAPVPDRAPVTQAALPAYAVEPAVRFEAADPPRPPRTRSPGEAQGSGPPRRLLVPRLGVDALVVAVRAAHRVLLPPADPQVLGWWRGGAEPGEARGSVVVTGHTVSSGGGALDDLETLRPGDVVRVRTTAGTVGYVVERSLVYRKARLARHARRVFSQTAPGRLVLVTCEGWNGTAYLSNAVVVARPVRAHRG